MSEPISRRKLFENSTVMGASLLSSQAVCSENRWGEDPLPHFVTDETCLTPAEDFYTVARGKPKPHSLQGQDLIYFDRLNNFNSFETFSTKVKFSLLAPVSK